MMLEAADEIDRLQESLGNTAELLTDVDVPDPADRINNALIGLK